MHMEDETRRVKEVNPRVRNPVFTSPPFLKYARSELISALEIIGNKLYIFNFKDT